MKTPEITVIAAGRFEVGESPVWDDRSGCLLWTDIPRGEIRELDLQTGALRQWSFGEPVGCFGLCESGRLVVALTRDVVLFDRRTGLQSPVATVEHAKPAMRFNDGKVGPDGAFWVGSADGSGEDDPQGVLYRVSGSGSVETITTGLRVSNGVAFSADGKRIYHSDSRGQWLDGLDLDPATGAATNRRRLVDLDETTGRPDGGACDVDGCYWSAGISASRLNRFSAVGELLDWIDLPVLRPTMPCFGGPDLMTLYVTSLSSGVSDKDLQEHPLCGAVIALPAPVRGVPVGRFAD